MTQRPTSQRGTVQPEGARSEVIAGLVNDGSARAVATAGIDHALAHGMSVCFIHVVSGDVRRQGADDVGDTTFAAVLAAMRGHGRLRCGFEVVRGDASRVLVDRSRTAGLLVIGHDTSAPQSSIADYCRLHAGCPVLTVEAGQRSRRPSPTLTPLTV